MKIREIILNKIEKQGEVTVADVVLETGFSRAYVHRFFSEMVKEGRLERIGTTKNAKYVLPKKGVKPKTIRFVLKNENLNEDIVLERVKNESAILENATKSSQDIFSYAFTEMLNNAIDHSNSKVVEVLAGANSKIVFFDIRDSGVGIFRNIKEKRGLKTEIEAIQDLLKGKQTTAPEAHSGEGIFFTSRAADKMVIYGSGKKIIFENRIKDTFVKDNPKRKGTRIYFEIAKKSKKDLGEIFKRYTGETFEFGKTEVEIKLYQMGTEYISRSQGRRVTTGLEKFKTVTLDFKNVDTVGQAFADEVFRVWQNQNPSTKIVAINANDNAQIMINHVLG